MLSDVMQADLLQCRCGCGEQNAGHVWYHCMYTDHVWGAVVDAATRVVHDTGTARDRAWWHALDESECVAHIVSAKCVMDAATERTLRSVVPGLGGRLLHLSTLHCQAQARAIPARVRCRVGGSGRRAMVRERGLVQRTED